MDEKTKYGKVTFRIFRDNKAAQISIDSVIIRYYAVFCSMGMPEILKNNREIIEHITPVIQKIADSYCESKEFSLLSYIKYHLLDEMFKSPCVGNLRAYVAVINI